jgi:hypothetical protein
VNKRFLVSFSISCYIILMSSVSSAMLPHSEISLGGVHINDTIDDVISLYGKPEHKESSKMDNTDLYMYSSPNFSVRFKNGKVFYILSIVDTRNQRTIPGGQRYAVLSTSRGIAPGMNPSLVEKKYGKADFLKGPDDFCYRDKDGCILEFNRGYAISCYIEHKK